MNMGNVYVLRDEHSRAVEHFRRGLAIFIEGYGAQHPDASLFRSNLAVGLDHLGEHELGLAQHRMALEADELNFGPDHPAVASTVFNIGCTLAELGDEDGAEEHFERAAKIFAEKLGQEHPQLGYVLTEHGRLCGDRGEVERGVRLLERAEAIRAEGDPALLALTRFRLASLLWTRDRGEDRSRALELATYARDTFADEAHADTALRTEIEKWLTERRAAS